MARMVGIFSVGRTVQHIAPTDETFEKIVKVAADTNALVDGLPHEVIPGGLALFFGKVETAGCFAFGMLNDCQIVFPAQCIGDLSHPVKCPLVAVELLAVLVVD